MYIEKDDDPKILEGKKLLSRITLPPRTAGTIEGSMLSSRMPSWEGPFKLCIKVVSA